MHALFRLTLCQNSEPGPSPDDTTRTLRPFLSKLAAYPFTRCTINFLSLSATPMNTLNLPRWIRDGWLA